ncbi:MAG: 6-phosphogluconolactonase [Candidatus Auribacterota bacterium]|nr:6-phosphogluconolactonase [Candidatus Auribacterota bacterium]
MSFKVIITRDFDHMSETAAGIIAEDIRSKPEYVIGLATGNSPTGLYKHLAKAANAGDFDTSLVTSFNLDEYVGLPGENAQQRTLHPESYSYFMVQELFGLLRKKFGSTYVPWGTLIDQDILSSEMKSHPEDWKEEGADKGKAIVISPEAGSDYLSWIRKEILDAYRERIRRSGGIDLHIVGVGGRGHVGFHEAGIPFEENEMLLVKLDENTVENAVADGHFEKREESPQYAISMGASLIYQAKTVLLLANGSRKTEPVMESLLMEPDCSVPISYGHIPAGNDGRMIYILDRAAAEGVIRNQDVLQERGIEIEDISEGEARVKVEDLRFSRDPEIGLLG